ncbi:MAG: hypothetical protein CM15mP121_3180 [Bacteroidota bacterium]|nr:MAG: hypothetical protein CM15mP121_3180 [Bacteroidota bacterium]
MTDQNTMFDMVQEAFENLGDKLILDDIELEVTLVIM